MNNNFCKQKADKNLVSIIIPVFNEQEVLDTFHISLKSVLNGIDLDSEIIYVNDGSTDRSMEVLLAIKQSDFRVNILDLSRNFGKEIAMTAGLDFAKGDAAVIIDADLQDPPELILEFLKYWHRGYDIVYAKRISRKGETTIKKVTARLFYYFIKRIGNIKIPENTGDYRLISKRALESLKMIREKHRFMKGLFAWIGYTQIAIEYNRNPRYAGKTKWNYWRLWNFAIEGFTSFTITPLKISTYIGFFTALFSFLYGFYFIVKTIFFGNPVPGYPSLLVVILFLGGIQLTAIGVVGEYLGRIFNESKNRPLYLLKELYIAESENK